MMNNRKVFAVLLIGMATVLWAEGVRWRSWDAGLEEAKAEHKIVVIDAVREGCRYCDDMQRAVFDDSVMAAYIEKRFVPVKVNISFERMPLGLKVPMTPSFYFISTGQKVIKVLPGSWNREDFREFLDGVNP